MYDLSNKQYIIKQSSGKTLNIFYKTNSGAFLSSLNKKDLWSEPSAITRDILPGYSVCSDNSDNIHILCQDRQGNIKYLHYDNVKWSTKSILRSRNFNPYDKHLHIISEERKTHFFYTVKYSEKILLTHQVLSYSGELSEPKVLDYVSECETPYIVTYDPNGDLYLFYTYQDNKYSRLGFKRYNAAKGIWSDFSPITRFNGESNILSSAYDDKDIIYACWQRRAAQNFELVLSIKTPSSSEWSSEKVITTSQEPFLNASLLVAKDRLILYWVHGSKIIHSVSYDFGDTWDSPEEYTFIPSEQTLCITYISSIPDYNFKQRCNILPGNTTNGYKLAFTDQNTTDALIIQSDKIVPDDFRTKVIESLTIISNDVSDLKRILQEVYEKIGLLENKENQIEIELGRYNSKLVIADSDLAKIRSLIDDMKQTYASSSNKTESQLAPTVELPKEINIPGNISGSTPIMPGAGFASITPEFLRSLQKK